VEGMPFYLSIFLKRKSGRTGFINVLDQKGIGYIHGSSNIEQISPPVNAEPPLFIKLALNGEQTTRLQKILDFYEVGMDFQVKRSVRSTAHQTLIHCSDMPRDQYIDVVNGIYTDLRDQMVEMNVKAIVADDKCVAFVTDVPSANGVQVPFYPKDKVLHLTMRLRDRSIRPVYSNVLAKRVLQERDSSAGDVYIELPQSIKLLCPLKFHFIT
jgi:tRNA splicing ligase